MSQTPIKLEYELLFIKIINRNRGGFCYELNSLFGWLLRSLGYKVRFTEAAVYSENKQEYGDMRNHMTLLIDLDETYLVDVGFGDGVRVPLKLNGELNEDVSRKYKIVMKDDMYYLQRMKDNQCVSQYRLLINDLKISDFQKNCDSIQTNPNSLFTQEKLYTIALDDGRVTLSENSFTLIENCVKIKLEYSEGKDFDYYKKEYESKYS